MAMVRDSCDVEVCIRSLWMLKSIALAPDSSLLALLYESTVPLITHEMFSTRFPSHVEPDVDRVHLLRAMALSA